MSNTRKKSGSRRDRPDAAPADPRELGFEEALEQIESIIDRIESGEVGLEQSLTEYERGVELIRRCRGILSRAEQRVEELNRRMDGDPADTRNDAGGTERRPAT